MSTNNQLVKIEFSSDQVALIKSQIAPKATNDELKLFLYQAQRTGLDPLARQIYAIHRKSGDKEHMTIQTSIDGFRVVAERSGVYAGQDKPLFGPDLEIEYKEKVWNGNQSSWVTKKRKVPEFAEVTVYKILNGQRYQAATGIAYWDEYYPGATNGTMWHKMPHTMLSKCAEALALRKAFPQDLSGLYTNDEMQQADKVPTEDASFTVVPAPQPVETVSEENDDFEL